MQQLSRDSYIYLIHQLNDLIAIFEQHPDPTTQEQVAALLSGIDALHREGLERLMAVLRQVGDDMLLERVLADPVVAIMLGVYDLAELPFPDAQEDPAPMTNFIPLDRITRRGSSSG